MLTDSNIVHGAWMPAVAGGHSILHPAAVEIPLICFPPGSIRSCNECSGRSDPRLSRHRAACRPRPRPARATLGNVVFGHLSRGARRTGDQTFVRTGRLVSVVSELPVDERFPAQPSSARCSSARASCLTRTCGTRQLPEMTAPLPLRSRPTSYGCMGQHAIIEPGTRAFANPSPASLLWRSAGFIGPRGAVMNTWTGQARKKQTWRATVQAMHADPQRDPKTARAPRCRLVPAKPDSFADG